jgi:hypothetical protein
MENVYGNNAFYWWVGVVEDRNDPLYLGRCKVRIVGHHSSDTGELPTSDLPWAFPMQPITSAAMSGVGQTPMGVVEGTWVIGFFRDGDDCQEPVIIGTMAGIPGKTYYNKIRNTSNLGFQDPGKKYPRESYLKNSEPDINRLARNETINETIVKKKDDSRVKGVEVANGGTAWDQPLTAYNAFYPYNHVHESESGHIIEIDDTNDNERLAMYHKTGTYVDIDRNGTMTRKVVGDSYEIFMRHNNVIIKGDANVTVEGNCNIYVKNNCNIEVDGDLKTNVHGDYELNVAGKIDIAAGKAFTAYTDKDMSIQAKTGISAKSNTTIDVESKTVTNIKAGTLLQMGGVIKTSISSPITEFAIVKFNGMSIVPVPPTPTTGATVRDLTPTKSASPKLPTFPTLTVPTRAERLTSTLDILGEDYKINAAVIKRVLAEAVADGIITKEELNTPAPKPTIVDSTQPPEKKQVIPGCGEINALSTIPDTLKISKFFTIASLTTQPAFPHRLRAFNGRTEHELACNLKALAEQILDPIKQKYPNMMITSGLRVVPAKGGSLTSQHMKGQAADLQFNGASRSQYFEIAQWIRDTLPFDQMLLEYTNQSPSWKTGGGCWIHVSYTRDGCRETFGTFMNHTYAQNGRNTLLQLG